MTKIELRRGARHSVWIAAGWMVLLSSPLSPRPLVGQAAPEHPSLSVVEAALDEYRDPIAAVHDGYFSSVGCVDFPAAGAAGEIPYPAGGMGVYFLNMGLVGPTVDSLSAGRRRRCSSSCSAGRRHGLSP